VVNEPTGCVNLGLSPFSRGVGNHANMNEAIRIRSRSFSVKKHFWTYGDQVRTVAQKIKGEVPAFPLWLIDRQRTLHWTHDA